MNSVAVQGFRGKLEILEKRRLDLDAARRDYNRLEQKRVKKSENGQEPPAELIIQIQAKETTLNGGPCFGLSHPWLFVHSPLALHFNPLPFLVRVPSFARCFAIGIPSTAFPDHTFPPGEEL